jgi:hypothetical protein
VSPRFEAWVVIVAITLAVPGFAGEPGGGGTVGEVATDPAKPTPGPKRAPKKRDPTLDLGIFPSVAYDSNLGVGFGAVWNVAKLDPAVFPYRFRHAGQVFLYVGRAPGGGLRVPLQHHYLTFDRPGKNRFLGRIYLRRQVNTGYYGIGNASPNERPWRSIDRKADPQGRAEARRYYEYDHWQAGFRLEARVPLGGPEGLSAWFGLAGSWNRVTAAPGSRLERDLRGERGSFVQDTLRGVSVHGLVQPAIGLVWDRRDEEIAPTRGFFHEASVRGSPILGERAGYAGLHAAMRFYIPIAAPGVVLAVRGLGDALFGDPPIYELARYGGTAPDDGPSGQLAVRGPPNQRWHGKIKLIGNAELRFRGFKMRLFGLPVRAGGLLFVDAGRVWADGARREELDGLGHGLHGAAGLGVRIRLGDTFVARLDAGVSIDGVAIYGDVHHIF